MARGKRYRRSASECLALADIVSNPSDRAMLVAMAARWHDLAERANEAGEPDPEPQLHLKRRARLRIVSEAGTVNPSSTRDRG